MLASLQSVSKNYQQNGKSIPALQQVDFELKPNQFVAVQGPSGCGKSTLLLTLGGLQRPDQGTVTVSDKNIYKLNANDRARLRSEQIGFVFQQFHLVPYLTAIENVLAARVSQGAAELPAFKERAESLLNHFGLGDRLHHRPGQLSIGERQRVALARALLNRPKILLADEPTGNLDEANAKIVLDEMNQFAADGGAVLLVTHDQNAANAATHRVTMESGKL